MTEFDLVLEYGGLPCGKVSGAFQLEWNANDAFTPLAKEQVQVLLA